MLNEADSRWIRVAAGARAGADVQTVDGGPYSVAAGNSFSPVFTGGKRLTLDGPNSQNQSRVDDIAQPKHRLSRSHPSRSSQ
jgi:hypothetical protein